MDSTAQRVKEEVPDRAAQLSDTINIGAAQVCLFEHKQYAFVLPACCDNGTDAWAVTELVTWERGSGS